MQLKFDWLIVLENLRRGIMVTDVTLPRQIVAGRERITPTARVVRRGGSEARVVEVSLDLCPDVGE